MLHNIESIHCVLSIQKYKGKIPITSLEMVDDISLQQLVVTDFSCLQCCQIGSILCENGPNRTKPGLFQIRFQYVSARKKSPRFVSFRANLTHFRADPDTRVSEIPVMAAGTRTMLSGRGSRIPGCQVDHTLY